MKKLVTGLISLSLILSLVACGSEDPAFSNGSASSPDASESASDVASSSDSSASSSSDEDEVAEISFEEVVVVDNDTCLIKIVDIEPDSFWGYSLAAYMENKSSDTTYMFSVLDASVNGVVCDPFFATEVAPGKKANEDISFSVESLEENGIGLLSDFELTFSVRDSDDWMADPVVVETVHIYPYGQEKATTFDRPAQPEDVVLVDNDYVTATVIGYTEDPIWGFLVNLFLENKTDKTVMFSVDDVSVNGYMADPFFATSVPPEKCAFASMSWSDSVFEDNNITDIEEIEFAFRAYDADDWLGDDFANTSITLAP